MLLLFACLIILAVYSTKISSRFGVPLLLLFLAIGLIVGSDVLNLFYFSDAALTKRIADILLIFILFDGGFRMTKRQFDPVSAPASILATFGVVLTAIILGALIHLLLGFELLYAMLVASIISSTDAAAVFMITKENPLKPRLSATLNVESAANDPMAILLTLAFLGLATGTSALTARFLLDLLWQFSGGILFGILFAYAARFLFDRLRSENRGNYYVLIIGMVLLAYGMADLAKANGIIAVFFMGYRLGNSEFPAKRGVSHFMEGIATFGNVSLFLMLGLLAFPREFVHVWKEGLLIAALLMFAARPVAVFLSTAPFGYSVKEKLFLSWGGIKGAVPVVLATYPAAFHLDPGGMIFNLIFFAVFLSCLLQGMTLTPLARLLKLTAPRHPVSPYTVEIHGTRKSDIDMFEFHVPRDAPCVGKRIADISLGRDVLISSIIRDERIILPKGGTELKENDILFILAHADRIKEISEKLQ